MSEDPDRALVEAARRGDRGAMERLYRQHSAVVHAYAFRASGSRDQADELTQETFIRAFRGVERFDGRATFRSWLFTICINCTRTRLRKRDRRPAEVELTEGQLQIEPVAPIGWTRDRISAALSALPEGYREAVIMHDVLEMDHSEIAQARGCSVGTSKSQLHKARAKLRALLGPLGV